MFNFHREWIRLQKLSTKQLKVRYCELFQEGTNTQNRIWLMRRIAWRLQALEQGGLSEPAQAKADELANDADLRVTLPKEELAKLSFAADPQQTVTESWQPPAGDVRVSGDPRLPPPGSILTRIYKGQKLEVIVLRDGFEFEGERYNSLSALAKAITGSHVNGFAFFQLNHGTKS